MSQFLSADEKHQMTRYKTRPNLVCLIYNEIYFNNESVWSSRRPCQLSAD